MPIARSGHSACLYGEYYMVIFAGILEVTKELDDMMVFDMRSSKWYTLFEEAMHSPNRKNFALSNGF